MARVTNKTFTERLLRSAKQAAAIKRGEVAAPRVNRREITARQAEVTPPPRYDV